MTEDITHGLSRLADEAEPAPIDSHAVVANARARTRSRRAVATAFASVATIGALTMTLTTDRSTDAATDGESASARLTAQLAAALPELIPARWETAPTPPDPPTATYPAPHTFWCDSDQPAPAYTPPPQDISPGPVNTSPLANAVHSYFPEGKTADRCRARDWYRDAEGQFELWLDVDDGDGWFFNPCMAPECEEWGLPDGTRVRMNVSAVGVSAYSGLQQVEGLRSDGTHIHVYVLWQNDRSAPPLTVDELVKFTDKFDY